MTEKQIQYFFTVYDNSSITKAADLLFVSRPVVSRTIQQIERELGFTLFTRKIDGVIPSESARLLYNMLREFSRAYESLLKQIRGAGSKRSLRIGVSYGCGNWFYPMIYKPFTERFPDISASIDGIHIRDIQQQLLYGTFDVAVGPMVDETAFGLETLELYKGMRVLCAPIANPYSDAGEISYEECRNLPMAVTDTLSDDASNYNNIVLSTRELEMVHMAVVSGLAYSVLPVEVCGNWSNITTIPFKPAICNSIFIQWSKKESANPCLRDFIRVVEDIDFQVLRETHGLLLK